MDRARPALSWSAHKVEAVVVEVKCTLEAAQLAAEALATRRTAGLFDESSFAKIEIAGPGAATFLDRLVDAVQLRTVR